MNEQEFNIVWEAYGKSVREMAVSMNKIGLEVPLTIIALGDDEAHRLRSDMLSGYTQNNASLMVSLSIMSDCMVKMFAQKHAGDLARELAGEMGIKDRMVAERYVSAMEALEKAIQDMSSVANMIMHSKNYERDGSRMYG